MNRSTRVLLVSLLGGCWLTACAPAAKSLVVLRADDDHTTGRVTVTTGGGDVTLDTANQSTAVGDAAHAPTPPVPMDEARIRALFGGALDAMPQPALHFVLHFESGGTELVAGSDATITAITAAMRDRGAGMVSVIGHSDTWGDADVNARISLERAEFVKERLRSIGLQGFEFEVSSHGEANPLVPTGDNVREEKNRRVEVVVR
jgi:outer membrane protein OmpA-like peptidoglycan-associated protein